MNPFEMVVAIVAITAIAGVLRAKYGAGRHSKDSGRAVTTQDSAETARLREDVKTLKERVAVLERLVTDSNSTLEREFEKLRDER